MGPKFAARFLFILLAFVCGGMIISHLNFDSKWNWFKQSTEIFPENSRRNLQSNAVTSKIYWMTLRLIHLDWCGNFDVTEMHPQLQIGATCKNQSVDEWSLRTKLAFLDWILHYLFLQILKILWGEWVAYQAFRSPGERNAATKCLIYSSFDVRSPSSFSIDLLNLWLVSRLVGR